MRFRANLHVRHLLFAGVAAVSISAAANAQDAAAQSQAQQSPDQTAAESSESTASTAPGDEDAPLGSGNEIIVTATKRAQTLQDVPVAVSVTTADTIERAQIRDITDLSSVVPSLKVSQNQSQFATTYSIRGFGTNGNNLGLEPSVAVFVDGVYRSRAISQISDLPDVERVEVLRGPQSTLFGKNASAGVISIITKKPSFTPHGSLEASYGNYNAAVVKGYLTGPITDTIAASISAGYNRRDGYLTNAYNGDDMNNRNRWFARGQLLFEPTPDFSFRVIGDYDKLDEKCCGVVNLRPSAATAAVRAVGGMVNDYRTPFADIVYSDVVPTSKIENWGVSGQGDYNFGHFKLTSITAYRETRLNADQDVDFTSARLATGANVGQSTIKTFTQELRLASDFDGPINFLLGGYYFNEKLKTADQIVYGDDFRNYANILVGGPVTSPPNDLAIQQLEGQISALTGTNYAGQFFASGQGFFDKFTQKDESWSVFGNVDIKLAEPLTLTLGANYTKDAKDVASNSVSTDVFSGLDLTSIGQTAIYAGALSQTLAGFGVDASNQAQVAAFASANPAAFAQIQSGAQAYAAANASDPSVNPLLALRPLQFLPPLQNFPNAVENGKTRDGDWTWSARLAYKFNRQINAYVSYATGFKASSWNLSRDSRPSLEDYTALVSRGLAVNNLVPGSRFAAPENSEVYELGIKANWGLASANLTFFKQSIKNFQTNTFTGTGFVFANADKESTFGIEFDGMVKPAEPLTLSLAMTYLDPKYDSFPNSPFGDLSGTEVFGIPRLSAVFGAEWNQPIGSNGDHLILRGDFDYSSPTQVEPGLLAFITTNPDGSRNYAPAYAAARPFVQEVTNLNASLTYSLGMGLDLTVWGRNLLDDRNITDVFDSVAQSQSISGYINQPRTYGVSARFKF
ncbi:TonB-dependent receptor [Porphyrobacter algicida]|uniref:TonB-dependent receptor n=1 Tax=Qipengyuania algicida TaxID=1836209 RepID=A0A845AEN8_9SPHN|nr:TonB-dependent receptor [Qipengyuania algicida]MXP28710.1 TonB-dependent receptor [Qipengyuania algicida]